MPLHSVHTPLRLWAAVVLTMASLPAWAQVKDDSISFDAPGLLGKKADKKSPDVKSSPQAWPRLDPGAAICRSVEDLARLAANRARTEGGGRADCQIVQVPTAVSVVQRMAPGRTQVRLTDRPTTVVWTDVWLPEKAPTKR